MTNDDINSLPQIRPGPISWLNEPIRTSIAETVRKYLNRKWTVLDEKDLSEFACHRVAILSDGEFGVFFKYAEEPDGNRQFEAELGDLQKLSELTGVLIPRPIGIIEVESCWLFLMEAVEPVERKEQQWREIGWTLARIHQVSGNCFGFDRNKYWGSLYQDNTQTEDWAEFFRERRLMPLLKIAVKSGNLPSPVRSDVELLAERLPGLCGSEVTPALLHGDAQANNFISSAAGAYVIDPAVFYGHPEWDLAIMSAWQDVPNDVFIGYREILPIDQGFKERCYLWRIPLYLAAVALEGQMHLNRLTGALRRYL